MPELAPRPSDDLKLKINVFASLVRKQEATAEDFKEISDILIWFADWVDGQVQPEGFYKFHTSLEILQAAYPDAPEDSFAVIVPDNGSQPYIAIVQNGVWVATQSQAPIQYADNKVALEQNDGQADILYIVKDEKLIALWYNAKYNYFGQDGANGASAYEVAVSLGFQGTEQQWIDSIKESLDFVWNGTQLGVKKTADAEYVYVDLVGPAGPSGADGDSAYEVWLSLGNSGTEQDFINSLTGPQGPDGAAGADGDSAYEVWLSLGNSGTEQDFINSLTGPQGADGAAGADGDSAYEVWLSLGNSGTEQDFINSLTGPEGAAGADGDSAYQTWLSLGNSGTEQDFINSLQGPAGADGVVDIKGEYSDNQSAINGGLSQGDVYSLPYDATKGTYLLAVVGPSSTFGKNSITVNSSTAQTGYPVYLNVYNTAGTNAPNNIYLNGQVRDDWGDVRMLDANGNYIPYAIIYEEATYITIVFKADLLSGDTEFFIDYNKPVQAGDVTKIAPHSDAHYDPAETLVDRDQSLVWLNNFKTRMIVYAPDVILEGGDKIGAVTTGEANRLSLAQDVTDKVSEASTAVGCPKYLWGWGNHDFDQGVTFTNFQAQYNGLPGQVSGKLYAAWEEGDYQYISLDANYNPADDTHMSDQHQGFGYIDPAQKTWLTNTLNAATKPCIILCHQLLGEVDTLRMQLTKEIFHVQNRTEIRNILEASGKVICVLNGHFHTTSVNVINGIPYLSVVNLSEPNPNTDQWDTPNTNIEGRWSLLEIDKGSKTMKFIQESRVSGTVYKVYEYRIPYKTSFDSEYGINAPQTFSENYTAKYEKPSVVMDASDFYVNDDAYITAKPASIYDSDPRLSDRTIKFYGYTGAPNYGRAYWNYALQTGKFKVRFSVYMNSLSIKSFKFMKEGGAIGVLFSYRETGEFWISNGNTNVINGSGYVINTWYDFELVVDVAAKTFNLFRDGVLIAENYAYYQSSATSLDYFELLSTQGNCFIDNFRIEKYTSPEPSVTDIGATE